MTKQYFQVHPDDIDAHWGLLSSLIKKAIDKTNNTDYTVEGLYNRIKSNYVQLFVVIEDDELNSIFITSVVPYDISSYLHVCLTVVVDGKKGDYSYWLDCFKEVAKLFNCNKISLTGRKGWGRFASRFNFKSETTHVTEIN